MVGSNYSSPQVRQPPTPATLYDILDLILDKGIVIDAFVKVSLVGIDLLTVEARVVIASVDTYLHYADVIQRLGLRNRSASAGESERNSQKGEQQELSRLGQSATGALGKLDRGLSQAGKTAGRTLEKGKQEVSQAGKAAGGALGKGEQELSQLGKTATDALGNDQSGQEGEDQDEGPGGLGVNRLTQAVGAGNGAQRRSSSGESNRASSKKQPARHAAHASAKKAGARQSR